MLNHIFEGFKSLIADIFNLPNIRIDLYDINQKILISHSEVSALCDTIQIAGNLSADCQMCISDSFKCCEKNRKTFIFKCFTGATVLIVPIFEKDEIIGFFRLSNMVLDSDKYFFIDNIKKLLSETSISTHCEHDLLNIINNAEYVGDKILSALANVLSKYANAYLKAPNNILKDFTQAQIIKKYIDEHLADSLTVSTICKDLYISKTGLYTTAQKVFGMGISDYIREKRIERSKRFLTETNMSVTQIAAEVGFSDSNYFTRVFKAEIGISPRLYRHNVNNILND